MPKKPKFYTLDRILQEEAHYNIIIGERSNGKTHAVLDLILRNYCDKKQQGAIIRRWKEDFVGKRGQQLFENFINLGLVEKYSKGEWTSIYYYSGRWYLCKHDENGKRILDDMPFAFGFAISDMEHDKSVSYASVTTIVFDEFLTRSVYLNDEFVLFMNVLSTIIRHRVNVKIFMLGNTVSKYGCPYIDEMGLKHIKDMKQGEIEVYTYGDSKLRVAVEYCSATAKKDKASNVYFAFDNPELKMNMITGGAWEMEIYPHLPIKYKSKDIMFTFFIQFDSETLQCEVVIKGLHNFVYVHRKTSEIQNPERDLIFSPENSSLPNYRRRITKPCNELEKKLLAYFNNDKVFYQSNEIGEVVRAYLLWCRG